MKITPFFVDSEDGTEYYVKAEYNPTFIAYMHGMGTWDKFKKVWVVPASEERKYAILDVMNLMFGFVLDTSDERIKRLEYYLSTSYNAILNETRKILGNDDVEDGVSPDDIYLTLLDMNGDDVQKLRESIEYFWKLEASLSKAEDDKIIYQ